MIVLNAISDWFYAVAVINFAWFGFLLVLFAAAIILNAIVKIKQRWMS